MKTKITITSHAKERAFQRYGVLFSRRHWGLFARLIGSGKQTIPLGSGRVVCFFSGRWFLLVCGPRGTVQTFLPQEDIFETEKELLRRHPLYRRINVDSFHVWSCSAEASSRLLKSSLPPTPLPEKPEDTEIPSEVLATAKKLLDRAIDR